MTTRFEDADLLERMASEVDGLSGSRPEGTSTDPDRILHAIADESIGAVATIIRKAGPMLDVRELFATAFVLGLATAHQEGLGWTEWVLSQDELCPLVNLGTYRAAGRRIASGGHE